MIDFDLKRLTSVFVIKITLYKGLQKINLSDH